MMRQGKKLLISVIVSFGASCGNASDPLTIQSFIDASNANDLVVKEKSEKWFSLIGAIDGQAMTVGECRIEMYEFDTSIKSGRDALSGIAKDGLGGRRLIRRNNLALLHHCKADNPDYEQVSEIFASL